ncbi:MAG: hypothetical protein ABIP35_04245 [Ginsengibacter sp.]
MKFSAAFATDINLKNPGNYNDIQASLQDVENNANNGYRIILPPGEFLFKSSVTIKKFISIKGYEFAAESINLIHYRKGGADKFLSIPVYRNSN